MEEGIFECRVCEEETSNDDEICSYECWQEWESGYSDYLERMAERRQMGLSNF